MVQRVKVNLEVVEAMLYFWQSTNERQKVAERYINDVTNMEGLTLVYDDEFNAESVRKIMSAVTNREPFSGKNKKEGRFWNNNLWMMEDLSYTDSMIQPIKRLNLQSIAEKLQAVEGNSKYEELEVVFSPLHNEEYYIRGNKLIINFFRVRPDMMGEDKTYIGETEIKEYVEEKLVELLNK